MSNGLLQTIPFNLEADITYLDIIKYIYKTIGEGDRGAEIQREGESLAGSILSTESNIGFSLMTWGS